MILRSLRLHASWIIINYTSHFVALKKNGHNSISTLTLITSEEWLSSQPEYASCWYLYELLPVWWERYLSFSLSLSSSLIGETGWPPQHAWAPLITQLLPRLAIVRPRDSASHQRSAGLARAAEPKRSAGGRGLWQSPHSLPGNIQVDNHLACTDIRFQSATGHLLLRPSQRMDYILSPPIFASPTLSHDGLVQFFIVSEKT